MERDAEYYSLRVGNDRNPDAAWDYSAPNPAAARIKDPIGLWRGVTIERQRQ